MRERMELLEKVLELWDRVDRGEIKLKDLQTYEKVIRLFNLMADADLTTARAELARAQAWAEIESMVPQLPDGEERRPPALPEDAPV
jgi:hypothetical protein